MNKKIEEIANNAEKFELYQPEKVLNRTRFLFSFEDKDKKKIVVVLSNITNEIELSIENPKDEKFNGFNFDLSAEENNLLCIAFEKALYKKRIEYRKNNKEDIQKIKNERKSKSDKNILETNKKIQKEAEKFLNTIIIY